MQSYLWRKEARFKKNGSIGKYIYIFIIFFPHYSNEVDEVEGPVIGYSAWMHDGQVMTWKTK